MQWMRFLLERGGYVQRRFITPQQPRTADGKVYVNLGCGANTSEEFINVDTRPMPHIHHIHEVEHLPMFADGSVDLLYASHLLEHVPRKNVHTTLKEWHRVLKAGGILRFGVHDFDGLVEVYERSGRDVTSIVDQLMGQDGLYDDHHTIWNYAYAKDVLEHTGFRDVRVWNPHTADHHAFIDKTMRTVIVNRKEINISLNVEAVK